MALKLKKARPVHFFLFCYYYYDRLLGPFMFADVIFEEKTINNKLKCFIQHGLMLFQLELLGFSNECTLFIIKIGHIIS